MTAQEIDLLVDAVRFQGFKMLQKSIGVFRSFAFLQPIDYRIHLLPIIAYLMDILDALESGDASDDRKEFLLSIFDGSSVFLLKMIRLHYGYRSRHRIGESPVQHFLHGSMLSLSHFCRILGDPIVPDDIQRSGIECRVFLHIIIESALFDDFEYLPGL